MENAYIFIWAVLGSLLVDLSFLDEEYQAEGAFPKRYKDGYYLALRFAIALAAGAIAIAQKINTPLFAIQVGASAPLILQRLARGVGPGKNRRTPPPTADKSIKAGPAVGTR